MELHHLRTFVIVADEASVTKAAQRLFMTPPTVSGHVKTLEEELNVLLFTRTARGMVLTEKGALLKQKAEQTLLAAQDLVNHATGMQTYLIGELAVGLNASPTFLQIAALTNALDVACPGITLNYSASSSGQIVAGLLKRQLDIGFVFGAVTSAEITTLPLTEIDLQIALPASFAAQIETLTWAEIGRLPWIYTDGHCPFQAIIDDLFAQQQLEIQQKVTTNDERTRLDLVRAGIGASLLVSAEAQQAADNGEIVLWSGNIPLKTTLSLAFLTIRKQEPLIAPVIDSVTILWPNH